MWALSTVSALCVVYILDPGAYGYTKDYPSLAASVAYNGLHRVAWAFALGWLIFACFHGYGGDRGKCSLWKACVKMNVILNSVGFVNTFLSWKAFQPLSRLAFTVYLVHYSLVQLLWNLNSSFSVNLTYLYCVSGLQLNCRLSGLSMYFYNTL